jgi:catechol 2,3-dioxygenase-like lactoylglutathione lyase family enzyme
MLGGSDVIAMAATTQPEKARAFYIDILGLSFQEDTPFALVFIAGTTMLRIAKLQTFTPHPFTALGWKVPDIEATARDLAARGVICERFPGMQQDDLGIWSAPDGAKVAWFKDPDGNILSLTQFL